MLTNKIKSKHKNSNIGSVGIIETAVINVPDANILNPNLNMVVGKRYTYKGLTYYLDANNVLHFSGSLQRSQRKITHFECAAFFEELSRILGFDINENGILTSIKFSPAIY